MYIDMDDKDSVNSIQTEAKDLRQMSKAPSFALQYGGGIQPIMKALSCSEAKAQEIYDAYWGLYPELKDYSDATEQMAEDKGYVTGFFGLKLRAANIKAKDNKARSKEVRTLNNMRSQSSAMLVTTALDKTQEWIETEDLIDDVMQNATVHDSIYGIVKEDANIIAELNKVLIGNMCVKYDGMIVENLASLELGRSWKDLTEIPNNITSDEVQTYLDKI